MVSPWDVAPTNGKDRYLSSVAQSRCCAVPVTLLPIHVDPVKAPVFGKRLVSQSGDAPKATRAPATWSGSRFGKGICVKAAQAHKSGNLDVVQRIVEDFTIM